MLKTLWPVCINNLAGSGKVGSRLCHGWYKVVTTFPEGGPNPGFVTPSSRLQGCSKVITSLNKQVIPAGLEQPWYMLVNIGVSISILHMQNNQVSGW